MQEQVRATIRESFDKVSTRKTQVQEFLSVLDIASDQNKVIQELDSHSLAERRGGDSISYLSDVDQKELFIPASRMDDLPTVLMRIGTDLSPEFVSGVPDGEFHVLGGSGLESLRAHEKRGIVVCSDFASCAAIHRVLEKPVIWALTEGNMSNVAASVRSRFPDSEIFLARGQERSVNNLIDVAREVDAQVCSPRNEKDELQEVSVYRGYSKSSEVLHEGHNGYFTLLNSSDVDINSISEEFLRLESKVKGKESMQKNAVEYSVQKAKAKEGSLAKKRERKQVALRSRRMK